MKHSFWDQYSRQKSLVHSLDPRVKIIFFILFVLAVTLTPFPRFFSLVVYFSFWLGLVLVSRIPPGHFFSRLVVAVPVILALAILAFFKQGIYFSLFLTSKSLICVLILILLSAATSFDRLLRALERLKIPHLFILILSFMYRYIFVLEDELERMGRALQSRSFKTNRNLIFKSLANFSGLFFIRSYERSERIYQAMQSRGFDGRMGVPEPLKLRGRDLVFMLVGTFLVSGVYLLK